MENRLASDHDRATVGISPATREIFDLARQGRFDEALALCQARLAENPLDAGYQQSIAGVYHLMKRWPEALRHQDKAIALMTNKTIGHFGRADIYYEMGDYAAAIADFTRLAEVGHDEGFGPYSYLYRADCHRRLGNYAQALADCAPVPDDFDFPGFLGYWEGGKHHLLAAIADDRAAPIPEAK